MSPAGLGKVKQLTAGSVWTCALITGGTVKCWGNNRAGSVGDGSTTDRLKPVAVKGLTKVQSLDAGGAHTCALLSGGKVKCWGGNRFTGALGDGTEENRLEARLSEGLIAGV